MEFKKTSKEDMSVVTISAIIVIILAISSATSKSEETGEPLLLYQWIIVNLFIIAITVVIDIVVIKKREKKRQLMKEQELNEIERRERAKREMYVTVNIKSGSIGHEGICELRQLFENNLFYVGNDSDTLYEMIGYEWDGARYKKVIKSDAQETETGRKKASGVAAGSYGVVGAIGKTDSISNRKSRREVTEREVEEQGSAIIRMKRVYDEKVFSFVIVCDSEMDKRIRCFNNVPV